MGILWDNLLELDELSASTNSVMKLLSILVVVLNDNSIASEVESLTGSLSTLVARLWPFLGHNISSVRHSCVKTLLTLLAGDVGTTDKSMYNYSNRTFTECPCIQYHIRSDFQRFYIERN